MSIPQYGNPVPNQPLVSTSQLQWDGINGYRKSIGAGLAAFVGLLIDAWADGSVTTAEWKTIAIGTITAAVTAYALPNAIKQTPPAPIAPPDPEDVKPGV